MALIDPGLTGTTQYDEWAAGSLTSGANPGFPGFGSSTAWPNPIGSSAAGSGDAELNKVTGTGNPASGSTYFGGFAQVANTLGGQMAVTDTTPVAGLANVVFQIQIGEAFGYDLFNDVLPTLNYNGGTQALAANTALTLEHLDTGMTFENPDTGEDEPIFVNTYLLQWDVSALGVTSLDLRFTAVQHAQLYALRLDQSDVFTQVPEPATITLAGGALVGFVALARTRRRRTR